MKKTLAILFLTFYSFSVGQEKIIEYESLTVKQQSAYDSTKLSIMKKGIIFKKWVAYQGTNRITDFKLYFLLNEIDEAGKEIGRELNYRLGLQQFIFGIYLFTYGMIYQSKDTQAGIWVDTGPGGILQNVGNVLMLWSASSIRKNQLPQQTVADYIENYNQELILKISQNKN